MRKLLACAFASCLIANSARADLILGTSHPVGSPLSASAGTVSGLMQINVVSDSTTDVMAAWQFNLVILGDVGSTGTLTFNSPASTGTPPPGAAEPPDYIFAGNNTLSGGIEVTNGGSSLRANDFADVPVLVPMSLKNFLEVDYFADAAASGLFGIFAERGGANTIWTDDGFSTRFFSNVPDGDGLVRIGEVSVTGRGPDAVPEPGSLTLLVIGSLGLFGACRRLRPHRSA